MCLTTTVYSSLGHFLGTIHLHIYTQSEVDMEHAAANVENVEKTPTIFFNQCMWVIGYVILLLYLKYIFLFIPLHPKHATQYTFVPRPPHSLLINSHLQYFECSQRVQKGRPGSEASYTPHKVQN